MVSISDGMQRAHAMRQEWIVTVASKESTFAHLVDLSKSEEYKALSRIRVLAVLSSVNGWSERSAVEALYHYGIGQKDTVASIRRAKAKVEAVDRLIKANPRLWKPRPSFPPGWPFVGKLTDLYESMPDTEVPEELIALIDSDSDGSDEQSTSQNDDIDSLASLLEDDDE